MKTAEHHVHVRRTARYFTAGKINAETKYLWFLLHGYGQLANHFISKFDCLDPVRNFLVAPEGLSKFYRNGFAGNVAASWMTKADRENEIDDYLFFLNKLYREIVPISVPRKFKINLLGFSQGAATASRWLCRSGLPFDNFIIYSGDLGNDIDVIDENLPLRNSRNFYIRGNEDEFIDSKYAENFKELFQKAKIQLEFISFKGKHEIKEVAMRELLARLDSSNVINPESQ